MNRWEAIGWLTILVCVTFQAGVLVGAEGVSYGPPTNMATPGLIGPSVDVNALYTVLWDYANVGAVVGLGWIMWGRREGFLEGVRQIQQRIDGED